MSICRLLTAVAALLSAAQVNAAPGDRDLSFGVGGVVVSDVSALDQGFHPPIAALQTDGKLIVAGTTQQATSDPNRPMKKSWMLRRYNVDGSLDWSFGQNLSGAQVVSFDVSFPNFFPPATNVLGDDYPTAVFLLARGFMVAGTSRYCIVVAGDHSCQAAVIVAHFNPDGTLDSTYGNEGKTVAMNAFADSAVLQSDGKLVVVQNLISRLVRLNADGSPDTAFAPSVACGGNGGLRLTQDDRIVVGTNPPGIPFGDPDGGPICFTRLNPDGTKDTTFGTSGTSTIAGARPGRFDFFIDGSGSIVASGALLAIPSYTTTPIVFRLKSDGTLDPVFGSGGTVPMDAVIDAIAGDCHGRTLVAVDSGSLVRLLQDGSLDPAFSAQTMFVSSMLVRPDGHIVVLAPASSGSGLYILQYQGDAPCASSLAVEYYYADWNYYFETAFPDEIAALDGGAFGGAWKRTGETFNVWPQPDVLTSPTCRFFSASFAPKSSHFYTPFPVECSAVRNDPSWQFEGVAFYLQIPSGYGTGNGNGYCPAGTIALYRAYNNGMGGAPNHRYTTSLATLNSMIAQGWTFEGEANTKVFACVPQ